jgi:hypothetical protein
MARPLRAAARIALCVVTTGLAGVVGLEAATRSRDRIWTDLGAGQGLAARTPGAYRLFAANEKALLKQLASAPLESSRARRPRGRLLTLPQPDGSFARFQVWRSSILSPALARQHRELRTYVAQGVDDPTASARLDFTPAGFHAMVLSPQGAVIVDPVGEGAARRYRSLWKGDALRTGDFRCDNTELSLRPSVPIETLAPSGANRRTYRLAMTATGEYTTFFGGIAQAQAQITTTINRVTGIFERDAAIRLNIVAFNIYTDPTTDPFTNGTSVDNQLLNENQADLDANVGAANYDVGHIVSQGGTGGFAPGDACVNGQKARGGTSRPNPSGDPFDVDFVAHELGHQFGGSHSFNGTTGSCGGARSASTAYEPGSGTTVMAYAGICPGSNPTGGENVQPNSDDYFHTISFDELTAFREGTGVCGVQAATGNTPPNVNAGPDVTIPTATPFTLVASGNDPNGDALTFTWEQFDLGDPSPPPNNANGPLFRSREGGSSPARTFPQLPDILSGAATPWEILPTVNRTMNFRATARDNRAGGGGVNFDSMVVTVAGAPFQVTAPNGGETLACGCNTTVTWDVGGGSIVPNVAILLSSDGGNTFPFVLSASTPNDGSESVTLPCTGTSTARVKLAPVGGAFFDISDADFTLQNVAPTVALNVTGGSVDANCVGLVSFSATVTDDCRVDAGDVATAVTLLTANATLGVPVVNVVQTDVRTVTITGSVAVSNLTGSPAVVQVQVSGADECLNPFLATQTASVVDASPPSISCPAPISVECSAPGGTPASDPQLVPFFGGVSALDNCDPVLSIVNDAPALFPLGATPVTFTATDDSNNSASCASTVTVVDTTPPTISLSLSPTLLWPPNHKLWDITATVTVSDVCDPAASFVLTSIVSDEPDNGNGDGNTNGDIQDAAFGTADTQFRLRAERQGGGDGRVYTVKYTATDGSGNTAQAVGYVFVPHDRRP